MRKESKLKEKIISENTIVKVRFWAVAVHYAEVFRVRLKRFIESWIQNRSFNKKNQPVKNVIT